MAQGVDLEVLDVSIDNLELDVVSKGKHGLSTDISEVLTDGLIEESMIGASDLKLTITDRDLQALNSGVFSTDVRVVLDGVPFSMTQVSLVDTERLELSFEHWLIAEMRKHKRPMRAARNTTTRAEFIHRMLKELRLPFVFVCPSLDKKQLVEAPKTSEVRSAIQSVEKTEESGRAPHVTHHNLTVKHAPMSSSQGQVISTALNAAAGQGASKKAAEALVVALIQEADAGNPTTGDKDSVGALQVRRSTAAGITKIDGHGTLDPMDVAEVSIHFLVAGYYGKGGAIALAREHPTWSPGEIAQACQGSAFPTAYDQWKDEAKLIVEDYEGGAGGFTQGPATKPAAEARYEYSRGLPEEPEDTFTAAVRLAGEVLWRFFVVGRKGTQAAVYFMNDDELIRSKPRYLIDPLTVGAGKLTFDVEVGQRLVAIRGKKVPKPSEAQLEARLDRWAAPPGTVIQLADYGPASGRWLVDSISRNLYDAAGTVHLRAPQKPTQEPRTSPSSSPEAAAEAGGGAAASPTMKAKLAAEHPELKVGVRELVAAILTKFPRLVITSTLRAGDTGSYHALGRACDLAADSGYMYTAAEWISANFTSQLTEGIHDPNLAVKDGHKVDGPVFYSSVWLAHASHIHVAV